MTMKAIVVSEFGGPEVLKFVNVEIPVIDSNQVLIRVESTSVNFADIKTRYGKKDARKLPFIPGIDAAGIIERVGSDVVELEAGQRVIAFPHHGSYAEYIVADENLTFALPDEISFELAAASPIVSFLSHMLYADVARLEQGESVLIHAAAGGVGTTAIQMAKILGAGQVIGTVGSKSKIDIALAAGADHVICYETDDFVGKVNELTDGIGVDIILDSVSGRLAERSVNCLAEYGRLVHFGNSSGETAYFKAADLHASCRSVLGFSLGTTRMKRPQLFRNTAEYVLSYLAEGSLKIIIGEHFHLRDAAKAHAWMESRQSTGKIVLDVTH